MTSSHGSRRVTLPDPSPLFFPIMLAWVLPPSIWALLSCSTDVMTAWAEVGVPVALPSDSSTRAAQLSVRTVPDFSSGLQFFFFMALLKPQSSLQHPSRNPLTRWGGSASCPWILYLEDGRIMTTAVIRDCRIWLKPHVGNSLRNALRYF